MLNRVRKAITSRSRLTLLLAALLLAGQSLLIVHQEVHASDPAGLEVECHTCSSTPNGGFTPDAGAMPVPPAPRVIAVVAPVIFFDEKALVSPRSARGPPR